MSIEKKLNKLIIISSPSGAGKTTICKFLLKKMKQIELSISYTTRQMRINEKNGKDYFFVSDEEFKRLIKNVVAVSIIIGISGCSLMSQKDPDVIVTTEPMLTKPEEGTVDKVTSAESVNLDSVDSKGYTLGNNVIYFEYDSSEIRSDYRSAIEAHSL